MSGRFPVHTGITMNSLGVNGVPDAAIIGSSDRGDLPASPVRFQGTTLTDWLKAANPATRFLSVSRKDRGAILPIGRSKGDVYWWTASNGTFSTSHYYRDTLPAWVHRFNARKPGQQYAGKEWNLLLPANAYPEPDSVPAENRGANFMFPHLVSPDSMIAARSTGAYPWMDRDHAAVRARRHQRARPRRLAGPHRHARDFAFDDRRDRPCVRAGFARDARSDPAPRPVPRRVLRLAVQDARRASRDRCAHGRPRDVAAARNQIDDLSEPRREGRIDRAASGARFARGSLPRAWTRPPSRSRMDPSSSSRNRMRSRRRACTRIPRSRVSRRTCGKIDGVLRADLITSLADGRHDQGHNRAALAAHVRARRTRAHDDHADALQLLGARRAIRRTDRRTTRDAHVPVLFYGDGVKPGKYTGFVRVVDMAPTLAELAGVKPLEKLDGHVLRQAIK